MANDVRGGAMSDSAKVKFRVIDFELTGSDDAVRDSIRSLADVFHQSRDRERAVALPAAPAPPERPALPEPQSKNEPPPPPETVAVMDDPRRGADRNRKRERESRYFAPLRMTNSKRMALTVAAPTPPAAHRWRAKSQAPASAAQ